MARPTRHAHPSRILSPSRTFFVTTKTSMGRALLQSERNATLFIDVLRSYVKARNISIEKAVQLIKGGFSYRVKKEQGYCGEVWQRGFSDIRVEDRESFLRHREYIAQNPVRRGLVDSPEKFPYCFLYLARQEAAGAKA